MRKMCPICGMRKNEAPLAVFCFSHFQRTQDWRFWLINWACGRKAKDVPRNVGEETPKVEFSRVIRANRVARSTRMSTFRKALRIKSFQSEDRTAGFPRSLPVAGSTVGQSAREDSRDDASKSASVNRRTAVKPILAPRFLGLAATSEIVWATAENRRVYESLGLARKRGWSSWGMVKTTW